MKFLVDMGISPQTATFANDLGYDAVHLHEQNLDRLSDPEILAKARREKRIVLAHDLDFGELMAASKARLPSVIIFRLHNMQPERVNQYLLRIIDQHNEELEKGAIVSVSEGQIRIRMLPISEE